MRRYFIFLTAVFLLVGLSSPIALAAPEEVAQSKSVQKGVQEVETSVEGLVTARDENISDDLGLRIDAFKKVLDLSLSEAKDLQVRALLIEKDPEDIALWREAALVTIENAVRHFELLKKKGVAHIKDLQAVKAEADEFRLWREENYVSTLQAVNDYSSLQKGRDILAIAKERSQKIAKDIAKLGKGSRATELQNFLTKAKKNLSAGEEELKAGEDLFRTSYILPLTTSSSELMVDASSSLSTSTPEKPIPLSASTTSTTPEKISTSTATSSLPLPAEETLPLSIKDLVRSSFGEVKQAYQVFIEMSGFVRKSL